MDPECVPLCDAINRIPGVRTTESCCGHDKGKFRVFFQPKDQRTLAILLYFLDSCHVGFRWDCAVYTDCAMLPARYYIQSQVEGDEAYEQANKVAEFINDFMNDEFDEWWLDRYGDKDEPNT
ncbi:hypothetical protein LCGC14_1309350 [marine sediment metagenome]|uniref:Uncharacterized protein n=1 Tax=marine sediment metagenome TaxID=412755 RepID=A0A0F9N415_9ZZZZ